MNNYVTYHLHTDCSLLDSCTSYQDYIDKAIELGQSAICFTEHGNVYNWIEKKEACDKKVLNIFMVLRCILHKHSTRI